PNPAPSHGGVYLRPQEGSEALPALDAFEDALMPLLKGIPVSPGYAEATAVVYDCEVHRRLYVPRRDVSSSEIHREYRRLEEAVDQSSQELEPAEAFARSGSGPGDPAAIFSAHSMLVRE